MTGDTRTSRGIRRTVPTIGSSGTQLVETTVEDIHGRIHLRRAANRRHIITDVLTNDEAEHLFTVGLEAVQRSRGQKPGA